ncbi:MAG: hypothetical protein VYA60_04655 [Pseudomonadota bacterium]|nr:hypothetical protein [Pseudomonadota bacterium]
MNSLHIDVITEKLKEMSEDELMARISYLSSAKNELDLFIPELFNTMKIAANNLSEAEDKMWLLEGDPEKIEAFDAACLLYKEAFIINDKAEKKYAGFVIEMSSIIVELDIAFDIINNLKQESNRDGFNTLCRNNKVWLHMTTIN